MTGEQHLLLQTLTGNQLLQGIIGLAGEYQFAVAVQAAELERLYQTLFIFVALAVAAAEEIGVTGLHGGDLGMEYIADPIADYRHPPGIATGPFDDPPTGELRHGQYLLGAMDRRANDELIIESLQGGAVVFDIDMVEVMDGEDERQPASRRGYVTGAVQRLRTATGKPATEPD